ncbi:MAG: gamma-butyrobetaine hydroxylase-like domain-containing protein [Solirubrobacterales bacterium]
MSNISGSQHTPTELKVKRAEKILEVAFDDGQTFRLPAELLRVESPSAEVQGHSPDEKKLVSGRSHVGIIAVEPVGNYAVKIVFDDLHDSGIFTWDYLYWLGANQDQIWREYEAALAQAGLSRHPAATGEGSPAPAPKHSGCGCGGGGGGGKGGCG